ncbi:MAG: peptidoglycan-associated lipoprotein Pal [Pseudomonadota bacterium]
MAPSSTKRLFLRGVAAATLALAVAACSKTPPPTAGAATPGSPADFSQNVGDRVQFTVDSSQINALGASILDRQAAWLQQYPRYQVTMEGHADERGTREYNIALSARRADAAKNYLVSRGISTTRIKTIAFGKERPVATCDNESCWTQNRRAVTVLN